MRWICHPPDEETVLSLARHFDLNPITAQLLVQRGLTSSEHIDAFFNPKLRQLEDPFRLSNMDRAVDRLRKAMRGGEEILVFGDYDVDGITSITLLVSILRRCGIFPRYIVPRRLQEGYGLTRAAIDRTLEEGSPDLFITVDCGTNSHREIGFLRDLEIDVLVIDHHTAKAEPPEDCILVNPHVYDRPDTPWRDLSAVGLVFKLVHGLLVQLRREDDRRAFEISLKNYLDLVALGTIADLVPLRAENRILAKAGLLRLRNTGRLGLKALFDVSGMALGSEIRPFDISFRLGPRLNASGRLADAAVPIEMLLGDDWDHCHKAAQMLDNVNRERQGIERSIFLQAEQQVEARYADHSGLVLYDPEWHTGVVGIVASRLMQKYHRPCIVLGAEGERARGSGRSIPGIDLVAVLKKCAPLLEHWGGHPMAVGVTLDPENVEALQKAFHEVVLQCAGGSLPTKEVELIDWLEPEQIREDLLDDLERFHPFGQGNPEPVFGIAGVVLKQRPEVFGNGHFRFRINPAGGIPISCIAWKMAHSVPATGQPLDMAVRLSWNYWNGRRNPQAQIVSWRAGGDSSQE